MTTGWYETSLLLFANARGAGTVLTVKCPSPGTHRETNARGLPGGMLAVGIDSHIIASQGGSPHFRFALPLNFRESLSSKIRDNFC